eukprot:8275876-Ditylum_brightwellii.AAC.1
MTRHHPIGSKITKRHTKKYLYHVYQGNTLEESAIVPNTRYIGGAFETIHSGGLSFHAQHH